MAPPEVQAARCAACVGRRIRGGANERKGKISTFGNDPARPRNLLARSSSGPHIRQPFRAVTPGKDVISGANGNRSAQACGLRLGDGMKPIARPSETTGPDLSGQPRRSCAADVAPAAMNVLAMRRFLEGAIHHDHECAAPDRRGLTIDPRTKGFGVLATKRTVDGNGGAPPGVHLEPRILTKCLPPYKCNALETPGVHIYQHPPVSPIRHRAFLDSPARGYTARWTLPAALRAGFSPRGGQQGDVDAQAPAP